MDQQDDLEEGNENHNDRNSNSSSAKEKKTASPAEVKQTTEPSKASAAASKKPTAATLSFNQWTLNPSSAIANTAGASIKSEPKFDADDDKDSLEDDVDYQNTKDYDENQHYEDDEEDFAQYRDSAIKDLKPAQSRFMSTLEENKSSPQIRDSL